MNKNDYIILGGVVTLAGVLILSKSLQTTQTTTQSTTGTTTSQTQTSTQQTTGSTTSSSSSTSSQGTQSTTQSVFNWYETPPTIVCFLPSQYTYTIVSFPPSGYQGLSVPGNPTSPYCAELPPPPVEVYFSQGNVIDAGGGANLVDTQLLYFIKGNYVTGSNGNIMTAGVEGGGLDYVTLQWSVTQNSTGTVNVSVPSIGGLKGSWTVYKWSYNPANLSWGGNYANQIATLLPGQSTQVAVSEYDVVFIVGDNGYVQVGVLILSQGNGYDITIQG
ncbi:hypothetical protein SPV2_gp37 [Sulfolobus polyhedral virus 2]|uniref:Uncharacterized protein n=1 Tax=Sulfolobus polyhedral virus 2 TaxID=2493125 RepID=A0A3S8NFJ1_9VIRU|nr:hypothetical protein KM458_gp37 [Sulfolobus polyhedral virus 2]AZI76036.1 hypothetical protein SPV2_gp37 [Sulfolobus polyhedral virus 2]